MILLLGILTRIGIGERRRCMTANLAYSTMDTIIARCALKCEAALGIAAMWAEVSAATWAEVSATTWTEV